MPLPRRGPARRASAGCACAAQITSALRGTTAAGCRDRPWERGCPPQTPLPPARRASPARPSCRAGVRRSGVQVFGCSGVRVDRPEHLNTCTPEHPSFRCAREPSDRGARSGRERPQRASGGEAPASAPGPGRPDAPPPMPPGSALLHPRGCCRRGRAAAPPPGRSGRAALPLHPGSVRALPGRTWCGPPPSPAPPAGPGRGPGRGWPATA